VRDGVVGAAETSLRANGKPAALLTIMKTGSVFDAGYCQSDQKTMCCPHQRAAATEGAQDYRAVRSVDFRQSVDCGCLTRRGDCSVFDGVDDPAVPGQFGGSTLIIAISIPLSILSSIIVLSAMGETMNTMTLGGLAISDRHPGG